ncbi:MAG TPA: alpha/beta fold hydrolase [Roseiflexaceae bacterium]|nr:alpha/beta fold hydrolase [Roseiflexaceae bacterium]
MRNGQHQLQKVLAPGRIARIAGATALGAAGVLVGAAAYATARINLRTPNTFFSDYTFSPFETQVEGYEEVTLRTGDGLRLSAWWLPRPESRQVVVGLAGHRSPKSDLLGIGSGLWRAGNNVLLFDWRSRGQSDIAQHSLAYYELRDAEAAVGYALERVPEARLGLIGYSMGASVAILLAAREPRVAGVVADSPFTGIAEVVAHGAAQLRLPPRLVVPMADRLTAWRYGYRFGAVRPIQAVAAISPRPLLLIHGGADSLIPVSHAHEFFATAREPKQCWIVEGADHCGAYFADRTGYIARVAAFFEQCLAEG